MPAAQTVQGYDSSASVIGGRAVTDRRRPDAGLLVLAAVAVLAQALDTAVGGRLAAQQAAVAINPLSYVSFVLGGVGGSAVLKLGVTVVAAVLFVEVARSGRANLARGFLVLSAAMGLLGFLIKLAA